MNHSTHSVSNAKHSLKQDCHQNRISPIIFAKNHLESSEESNNHRGTLDSEWIPLECTDAYLPSQNGKIPAVDIQLHGVIFRSHSTDYFWAREEFSLTNAKFTEVLVKESLHLLVGRHREGLNGPNLICKRNHWQAYPVVLQTEHDHSHRNSYCLLNQIQSSVSNVTYLGQIVVETLHDRGIWCDIEEQVDGSSHYFT